MMPDWQHCGDKSLMHSLSACLGGCLFVCHLFMCQWHHSRQGVHTRSSWWRLRVSRRSWTATVGKSALQSSTLLDLPLLWRTCTQGPW